VNRSIVADDREPESVVHALRNMPGIELSVRRLKTGDYLADGRLVVERKTLLDFARSIIQGRLFRQAERLASSKIPAMIILEGKGADLAGTGLSREAFQGALISLSLIFGLPVLRSRDPAETARLINYAGDQISRAASDAIHRPGLRPKGKRGLQLYILQSLPGIGPRKARNLLKFFGSVDAVFRAEAPTLSQVHGIGRKTADGIRWAVEEARGKYA